MTFTIEGHPSNPHEQYSDAWYEWENDRVTAEARKEFLELRERLGELSQPEPEISCEEAYNEISLLLKNEKVIAPSHIRLKLIELKEKYSPVISAWDFDKLVESIREEKKAKDPDKRLKLDVLEWADETDPTRKLRRKGEICSTYRISAKDLEALALSLGKGSTAIQAKRFTGEQFLALESEGLDWLVPGVVPGRGITILAGSPGAGKSTLAYDLAASVLYKEEWLGEVPAKTGKVLFVSSDELPCFAQDKLINRGVAFNNDWDFITDWDVSQKQVLEEALEDVRPTLVIIDSFSSIHRDASFDENSAQAKATIYWLESVLNRYSCAGVLIHHVSKDKEKKGVNKVRGNGAIAAAASCVLLLEGEGNVKTLSAPKIRGAESFRWQVSMDGSTGRFSLIEGKDESDKPLAHKILEFFKTAARSQRLAFEEILKNVGGAKDAAYKALQRLVMRGQLIKRPGTRDPRQRVWGLPKIAGLAEETVEVLSPPPTRSNLSNIISETQPEQSLEHIGQIVDKLWTDVGQQPENQPSPTASIADAASNVEIILDTPAEGGGESPPDKPKEPIEPWEGAPRDEGAGDFQKGNQVVKGNGFGAKRGELVRYAGSAHWQVRVGKKQLELWKVGTFRRAVK